MPTLIIFLRKSLISSQTTRKFMDAFDLREWPGFQEAGGNPSLPAIVDQIVIDSRRIDSPKSLFVALPGAYEDGHRFVAHAAKTGASYALIQKNKNFEETSESICLLKVDDPLRAFQQIVQAYRKKLKTTVVGITGSYGKTMVKDLLLLMVGQSKNTVASPESFNSQIGVPLSLLTVKQEHEIALIEAGISKQHEMDHLAEMILPNYGILTHIGKRHVSTLGNLTAITQESMKLMGKIEPPGKVLLPSNIQANPFLKELKTDYFFWNHKNAPLPHAIRLNKNTGPMMQYRVNYPDGNILLGHTSSGFYYFIDLLNMTIKAAWLLGVSSEDISAVLRSYSPEPTRMEIWKASTGTTFINDSYCSDPQSVDLALRHLEQTSSGQRKVFVFGGLRGHKTQVETDYRRIGKAINRSNVKLLFLVGPHPYNALIEQVQKDSPHIEIACCPHFDEALLHMRNRLRSDDTVLIKGDKKQPLDQITEAFNESICNNQCIINLAAIESNLLAIRKRLPENTRIMIMVKAFAYGMDDIRIAKFLLRCKIDILGVSYVDEGVTLRRAGVTQQIFVINTAIYEAYKVVKWNLEVGVHDREQILALEREAFKQGKKIKVHLHIDTGMSRFGCRPEEALYLVECILECPSLILEGVMTHFAAADNPRHDDFTRKQALIFDQALAALQQKGLSVPWIHASNSSAMVRFQFPQYNMVRIGLAMYGLHSSEATRQEMDLRLSLSLISRIVGINHCKKGETISYGRSYVVQREEEKIAVLPIGYFDGLHCNYSGKGHVIIRGQKAPMVGKICMDYMMVDVTDIPHVAPGDSVLIFGEDEHGHYLSPEALALQGDSIVYELITCLGPRIQRIFVHEESSSKILSFEAVNEAVLN